MAMELVKTPAHRSSMSSTIALWPSERASPELQSIMNREIDGPATISEHGFEPGLPCWVKPTDVSDAIRAEARSIQAMLDLPSPTEASAAWLGDLATACAGKMPMQELIVRSALYLRLCQDIPAVAINDATLLRACRRWPEWFPTMGKFDEFMEELKREVAESRRRLKYLVNL